MDLVCQLFPQIIYDIKRLGITMAFGGSSVVFIREIPMLRTYHLHARVISWSNKWIYVQGVFTLPPRKGQSSKPARQLPTLLNNINADPGITSGTSTPQTTPRSVASTLPNGEVICAVIYGRYVFKRKTKETVPVPKALEICGYIDNSEVEKKRIEGWEYVKGLDQNWDPDTAFSSTNGILN
jgi:hypothetical protein